MNRINAFVAHSFVAEDKVLIGAFLEYFRQLSGLHSSFTWANAEAAEPTELADKVKAIVSDKNVLIAICTKKERVVSQAQLSKLVFQPAYLKAREVDFEWQTSDWITQEIGLAIGRDMRLVLLLEEGVRLPGGLQGDLEYIAFERTAPEKAFGRILEMLKALSPRAPVEEAVTSGPPEPQEAPVADDASDNDAWKTPRPEWRQNEYDYAAFRHIAEDDQAGELAISIAYFSTEAGSDPKNARRWDAFREWIRIHLLKGGKLSKLKEMATQHPGDPELWSFLAEAFNRLDHHAHAADAFRRAADLTPDLQRRLNLLRRASVSERRAGHVEASASLLDAMKGLADNTEESERKVLAAERAAAEAVKEDHLLVGILERLADLDPADIDLRFTLAFKHSELEDNDLTLLHYLLIPQPDRSAIAWNNLGVAYEQLDLQARSVDAYRMAEDKGETLAMSNLANRLLRAGFLAEAETICQKALTVADYHKNVPTSIKRVKEVPDEETKKEAESLERARRVSDFYKRFGHAVTRPVITVLSGSWIGPDCMLQVSIEAGSFTATGHYERPSNTLLSLSYVGLSKPDSPPLKFVVQFKGVIRGHSVVGTVSRHLEGEEVKLRSLLLDDGPPKVLMAISDDASEILVLERLKKNPPSFYSLKRSARS